MEDLIIYANILFDERNVGQSSHPLPPAPSNEPAAPIGYGSAYTQISSVPARQQKPETQLNQDFNPQLPARPGNSIHPSRRVNNQSSRGTTAASDDELLHAESESVQSVNTSTTVTVVPPSLEIPEPDITHYSTPDPSPNESSSISRSPRVCDASSSRRSNESQRSTRSARSNSARQSHDQPRVISP